jgi:hypothetical protein
MSLYVPLLCLKLRRDTFVGQGMQIFLHGSIISRVFDEKTMHQMQNLDATVISVDGSKKIVGGRPEVSLHVPHLPMPSLTSAKSLHSYTGIYGSNTTGKCVPVHWQLPLSTTAEEMKRLLFKFLHHVLNTCGRFVCEE